MQCNGRRRWLPRGPHPRPSLLPACWKAREGSGRSPAQCCCREREASFTGCFCMNAASHDSVARCLCIYHKLECNEKLKRGKCNKNRKQRKSRRRMRMGFALLESRLVDTNSLKRATIAAPSAALDPSAPQSPFRRSVNALQPSSSSIYGGWRTSDRSRSLQQAENPSVPLSTPSLASSAVS